MQLRASAFTALWIALSVAVAGCGGEDTQGTSGSGASSSGASSSGASSSGASSSGMVDMTINGCAAQDAEDMTGATDVTITFTDFSYTPACVRILAGSKVTFSGDFMMHPLVGGEVVSGIQAPDPLSPITKTDMGTTADFTIDVAGTYPYYCDFHASLKMYGAIFAE